MHQIDAMVNLPASMNLEEDVSGVVTEAMYKTDLSAARST